MSGKHTVYYLWNNCTCIKKYILVTRNQKKKAFYKVLKDYLNIYIIIKYKNDP